MCNFSSGAVGRLLFSVVWLTSQDLVRTPGMVLRLAEKSGDSWGGSAQGRFEYSSSSGTGAWPEHRIKAELVRNAVPFAVVNTL